MNFSLIKKYLQDKPMCIVPQESDDFNKALLKYTASKNLPTLSYKGSFYIVKGERKEEEKVEGV